MRGNTFHVLVFFTYGNSLETWAHAGLLDRELLLYKKMVQQGHRVTFLTYGEKQDNRYREDLDGIEVVPVYEFWRKSRNRWINVLTSFLIPFTPKVRRLFQSADIFKTNQMVGSWVPVIASLCFKKPLVVRCGYEMLRNMTRDENNLIKWLIKAVFGYFLEFMTYLSADRIIISNASDEKFIKSLFPFKRKKLSMIRNFIDTDQFRADSVIEESRPDRRLLFIGRLEPCKNIENLIQGAVMEKCRLDIIGKGALEDSLKQFVRDNQYDVHFLGTFANRELPSIIQKYNFYILPSFYECSPKTLLEAMACQRVVIGTNVDGIRELIKNEETGFLCGTDVVSISQTLRKVLTAPVDTLIEIGRRARQSIISQCSMDSVYQKEMQIYQEMLL